VEKIRTVIYFEDHFDLFYLEQDGKVRQKIDLGIYYCNTPRPFLVGI